MKRIGRAWIALVSSIALADEDIRDIRGPKTLSAASWWMTAMVGGAVIAIALCAYFLWRRRHYRGPRTNLTLAQQALQRLEETRPLMRPDSAREFGIAASEVIRSYLEKRFAVVVTQRTTEEFLYALLQESNEALTRHRPLLAQFLERCDFIKFAGETLAMADLESLYQSARGFVLETGERPVA
jgi:uncharacterized protein DUF4381